MNTFDQRSLALLTLKAVSKKKFSLGTLFALIFSLSNIMEKVPFL